MQCVLGLLFLAAVVAISAALIFGGIALIRRERHKIRGSGTLGVAVQELESLFVESKKQVIEAERAEKAEEQSPSGDPPEK